MKNAKDESDIDLMIICKKETLWSTRLVAYLLLLLSGFSVRKPKDKEEKDRLCINIWLDETNLLWVKQNIFTAHEIAQAIPLVNKNKTWEKFVKENSWTVNFWPKAILGHKKTSRKLEQKRLANLLLRGFNPLAFWAQLAYMKSKVTREVVSPNRALFHPVDWSEEVLSYLSST